MKNNYLLPFFLLMSFIFSARGDLISAEMLGTRSVNNNQFYVDDELSAISGQFSLNPVTYGYWLYKITYETIIF